MRRLLLQSPAFARDLKKWLKSHPDAADSIAELTSDAETLKARLVATTKKITNQRQADAIEAFSDAIDAG